MKIVTISGVQGAEARALDRDVPYVSQRTPEGAPVGYDGEANCGPTSMTMIARHLGLRRGGTDAAVVLELAKVGQTTAEHGTSLDGMRTIGRHLGLECEVSPGIDLAGVRRALAEGGYVIANGDYHAMRPHADPDQYEGHYVLVYGLDARGRFLVHDPYDFAVEAVTALEMGQFLAAHEEGGYTITVRPPAIVTPATTSASGDRWEPRGAPTLSDSLWPPISSNDRALLPGRRRRRSAAQRPA